jgi:hypothetical protein
MGTRKEGLLLAFQSVILGQLLIRHGSHVLGDLRRPRDQVNRAFELHSVLHVAQQLR